ncbi:MAG: pentapeptide repeat-containing protein [Allosphingosinicella sp.]
MAEGAEAEVTGRAEAGRYPAHANMVLTRLEANFVRAVEDGTTFRPVPGDEDWDKGIRGELIRAMLLGTELEHHSRKRNAQRRKTKVTAHGLRIQAGEGRPGAGAAARLLAVKGRLDLGGLAAEGGGYLPPLELNGCRFEEPIELAGAHLRSLTLRNSRFSRLAAQGAKFDGGVTLSGCGPRNESEDKEERRCATVDLARIEKSGRKEAYKFVPTRTVPRGTRRGCECPACRSAGAGDNCGLCCVIDLSSVAVAGGLEISSTYLRAPAPKGPKHDPNIRRCCAADLSHAYVRDTLQILRCTFVGGASFVSAEVDDDLWIQGGKFLAAADSYVLDFQFATIGGVLALQAAAETDLRKRQAGIRVYPVVVVGQLTGISLSAGEVWVGEGFYYGHDQSGQGSFPAINFAKADIGRSFKVGAYHPQHVTDPARPTGEARIRGEICLHAANIGKNLEVHGADYEGFPNILDRTIERFGPACPGPDGRPANREKPYLKLRGHGLTVDRRVFISHAHFRDLEIASAQRPAKPAGEADKNPGAPGAVDLWKSTIGIGFRLSEDCTFTGALRLNSCVIGRELVIDCDSIEPSATDLASDQIAADDIPVLVDISESTIRGHLKVGRRVPRPMAATGTAVTICGALNLESTSVQGRLLLGHVMIDLTDYRVAPEERADVPPGGVSRPEEKAGKPESNRVALYLRDCTCGSDFEVHALRWRLPEPTARERRSIRQAPRGFFAILPSRHKSRFRQIEKSSFAEIDLRGLQCGMLIDGFGAEWGLIYRLRLRLAGMKFREVEPASHKPPHARIPGAERARLRWLARQNSTQEMVEEWETPSEPEPAPEPEPEPEPPKDGRRKWWGLLWASFWERHYCALDEDFVPQAYDVFSSAYRKGGEDSVSQEILVEKKNVENAMRFRRLWGIWRSSVWPTGAGQKYAAATGPRPLWKGIWKTGSPYLVGAGLVLWVITRWAEVSPIGSALALAAIAALIFLWPVVVAISQVIFRAGFRYGLSSDRALLVFFVCIAVGWVAVHVARNGGVRSAAAGELTDEVALVLDVGYEPIADDGPESPAAADPSARTDNPAPMRELGHVVHARASPCNLDVNSLLYTVDIFIPLIDLDQERRCTIRDVDEGASHDRYALWRLAKALYELIGWIITSLVILTITGVLRRDLER